MKTFTYTLKQIDEKSAIGPAAFLPQDAITGIPISGNLFAGKASIDDLAIISDFNPSEITDMEFMDAYLGGGTGSAKYALQVSMSLGYDTGLGYRLGMLDSDRNSFTQLLVLLREAQAPDYMNVSVADTSGSLHSMPVSTFREVMVSYGMFYNMIWAASKG